LLSYYPIGTPVSAFPPLRFNAINMIERYHQSPLTSYGEFTLAGPIASTLVPLPYVGFGLNEIAKEEASGLYYGVTDHDLYRIDMASSTAERIVPGSNVPEVHWTSAITYDTRRERMIVGTRDGDLYAYQPATNAWSFLADGANLGLLALAYAENDDLIYGLTQPYGEIAPPLLYKFNSRGAILGVTSLGDPMLPGSLQWEAQLVAVGDYLVIPKPSGTLDPIERIYLVNPHTGKVWYTVPEPSTLALLAMMTIGLIAYGWRQKRR
jgi:hypothetical protein